MIYIKATPVYFASQFQRLLKRLEFQSNHPGIDEQDYRQEIGRLIFLAGEMLPENDFIELMSALIKRFNFNPKYHKTLFTQSFPTSK